MTEDDKANELYDKIYIAKAEFNSKINNIRRMATADTSPFIDRTWLIKIEEYADEYAETVATLTATAGNTITTLRKRLAVRCNEVRYLKEQLAVLRDNKTVTDLRKLSAIVKGKNYDK